MRLPEDRDKTLLTRRQFVVGSVAAMASIVGLGTYSTQVEPFWIEVVRRPLPITGLPQDLAGARLVQIADLHVGPVVPDDYVVKTLEGVAALRPDILVVSGDLVARADEEQVRRVLSHLPIARLATVCTLGNHDYGAGWSDLTYADMVTDVARNCGASVLRNETIDIAGLQIVGMDDLWANRFDPAKAFSTADMDAPILCVSHNPDTVDLPGWDQYRGWILSGHTHGGQVRLPFLPPFRLPVRNRRYTAGEFELNRDRNLYINKGIGFLRQVRLDVRPEITVFDLQRA